MSNFRLNLPIDIPWKLVNCSEDMMDKTFCDKKMPTPFRSSISLYTYQPKDEDLPEEYINCGQTITYLKVSCSITGYNHSEEVKGQIVDLLSSIDEIDYSKIEQIKEEYFGCYGVMLNVSVHPSEKNKEDIKKYPHIIDFEPKVRDFYQAASETGEVLTASTGKLSTAKSYGTVDSTQNSWNAGTTLRVPEKSVDVAGVGGIKEGSPGEVRADTGQVRTETDQANWGVSTDASRERREGQSTTTQLSQMYNLLTGYHSGTNRTSFIMLPRPHILQPTDRRTFVQGLRVIEGIQDFFLIVLRDKSDKDLRVDVNLQTGHFPEVVSLIEPKDKIPITTSIKFQFDEVLMRDKIYELGPDRYAKTMDLKEIYELNDGWKLDLEKSNRGIKESKIGQSTPCSGDTLHSTDPNHVYYCDKQITKTTFTIEQTSLKVDVEYIAKGWSLTEWYDHNAYFKREYEVFLYKEENDSSEKHADNNNILITQRKLCTQITYNDCISSIDLTKPRDIKDLIDIDGVYEPPFDLSGILPPKNSIGNEPGINPDIVGGRVGPNPFPTNFAFQKAILRKISGTLINAANSSSFQTQNKINFIQSKSFQNQLLQILPKKVLESPANSIKILNKDISSKFSKDITLKKLLTMHSIQLTKQFGVSKGEILISKSGNENIK